MAQGSDLSGGKNNTSGMLRGACGEVNGDTAVETFAQHGEWYGMVLLLIGVLGKPENADFSPGLLRIWSNPSGIGGIRRVPLYLVCGD